ncbi:MAG: trigger factor [Crinalium sp.]
MKVTQEKLPASQIGLEIEIPAEMSKTVYEKVVQNLSRTANIPGFRKGKVPRQILVQRMGTQRLKAAALEDLIQEGFKKALEQEDIPAIGNYQVLSPMEDMVTRFQPGEAFTFSASVDVTPEVNLGEYTGWQLQAEEVVYDESEVDKFLDERRAEKATLIPVEGRPAQQGDVAVVDFAGVFADVAEGETPAEIPGAQATDFEIELGEGRFIEDIVNGIVGMNTGETKEVSVTFPEDYPREDLAGKAALFTITLKDLKEKELPELNDDFAQEASDFDNLAELRESLETRFKDKAAQATKANKEQVLVEQLLKQVEVDLPESLIEQEVQTQMRQTIMQMQQMGMDVNKVLNEEMVKQLAQRSRPEALTRLKQSLALEEIAKRESIEIQPEELEAKIAEWMQQLSGQEINPQRLREVVEADLRKEKAINWLEEHSTLEMVPQGSLVTAESDSEAEATTDATEAREVEVEVVSETE